MKRSLFVFLTCLLLLCLFGCSSRQNSIEYHYVSNVQDILFTIDPDASTISDGIHTYSYAIDSRRNGFTINLTYPDGAEYFWASRSSGSISTASGDFKGEPAGADYTDPMILCQALESKAMEKPRQIPALLCLLLMGMGAVMVLAPQTVWFLRWGWQFRDAEPSSLALGVSRASGVAVILAGIVFLFL